MTKTLLIIDGNSIACRGAFAGTVLTNTAGRETGGTMRFFSMIDKAMKMVRATHVVVSWDVGGANFRKDLDDDYKANRGPKSDSLYNQFFDIKKILDAIGMKHVGVVGYEGDDVIGTYATKSEADRTFIFSGDKDMFQLIDEKTTCVFPNTGISDIQLMDLKTFTEKYELTTEQYVELKALMGDGSDNIKGVTKCGQKTATKWLKQYGDLENIILNASDIKGKVGENLREWIPEASKTMELVRIKRNVPVPYDYKDLEIDLNWSAAKEIFFELEFNSLLKRVVKGEMYNATKK